MNQFKTQYLLSPWAGRLTGWGRDLHNIEIHVTSDVLYIQHVLYFWNNKVKKTLILYSQNGIHGTPVLSVFILPPLNPPYPIFPYLTSSCIMVEFGV